MNALKHGMTGLGVVLPPTDIAEVERRSIAMTRDFAPETETGKFLVRRLALISVRVERCSRNEFAAVADRVNHAPEIFDERRRAEVDHALSYLGHEPATHVRKLRSSPEGIDSLIACLLDLRGELSMPGGGRWSGAYGQHVAELMGERYFMVPTLRVRAISEAIEGKFEYLLPGDGDGLNLQEKKAWARNQMRALIDAEVADLRALREALDMSLVEEDRANAADLALFEPSREACLARRYEAAAERAFFRTLRQIGEVEAAGAGAPESIGEIPDAVALNGLVASESETKPTPRPVDLPRTRYLKIETPVDPLREAERRLEEGLRSIGAGGLYKDR